MNACPRLSTPASEVEVASRSHPKGAADYTHNVASNEELRRRAAEGDDLALVELGRRTAENVREARAA